MISKNLSNAVCTVSKIQFHYIINSKIKILPMFKITLTNVILSIRPTENRMLIYNNFITFDCKRQEKAVCSKDFWESR